MRKNMKKIITSLLTCCLFLGSTATSVFAKDTNLQNDSVDTTITSEYMSVDENNTYIFKNSEDEYDFRLSEISTRACLPSDPYYPTCNNYSEPYRDTYMGTSYEYGKFMGYHTQYWDYPSSYTITEGYSLNFSASFEISEFKGSVSANYSRSIGKTYQADGSRASKLGAFADLKIAKYKREILDSNGNVTRTIYYGNPTVLDAYSKVVYR